MRGQVASLAKQVSAQEQEQAKAQEGESEDGRREELGQIGMKT